MSDTEEYKTTLHRQHNHVQSIFENALGEVAPGRLLANQVSYDGRFLKIGNESIECGDESGIRVFGVGKAAGAMAESIEYVLGDAIEDGIVIAPYDDQHSFNRIQLFEAAHPLPDENSLASALEMMSVMKKVEEGDLIIFLLSGGASSLACVPAGELDLQDIRKTNQALMNSGATIHEMNSVRRHLSEIKGGNLARILPQCTVAQLIISDVPGNHLQDIGSGPLVPDSSTYEDALDVIYKYNLADQIPQQVQVHLLEGMQGHNPETLKHDETTEAEIFSYNLASSQIIAEAAGTYARSIGYNCHVFDPAYTGQTRVIARQMAGKSIDILSRNTTVSKPAAIIYHGESYPEVTGSGKGGRNQELALCFALAVEGQHCITMISAGTDGVDGPTDAAGAICNSETALEARRSGHEPEYYLRNNDSHTFFKAMNSLVHTGPTGTNVMDLQIILIEK